MEKIIERDKDGNLAAVLSVKMLGGGNYHVRVTELDKIIAAMASKETRVLLLEDPYDMTPVVLRADQISGVCFVTDKGTSEYKKFDMRGSQIVKGLEPKEWEDG